MSESRQSFIPEHEITNTRHVLNLLRTQVKTGHLDAEYFIRQLDNVDGLLGRFNEVQQQQRSAGRFEALYQVTRSLGTSLDLQTVLDETMDAVISLTGAERAFLMLRNDDGVLQVKAARNYDQKTFNSQDFKYSRTIANQVLDEGKPILTTNAVEDPRFAGQASIVSQSLRSIMATPLWARNAVIGVAYVENRIVAGLFSEDDLTTLETLGGQAAIAIDNALLFEATDEALARRVEELRQLRRIDLLLNEKLDPQQVALYTLEWACRLSEATSGVLGWVESDPRRIVAAQHYPAESAPEGETVYLDHVYPGIWAAVDDSKALLMDVGQYGLHTALAVPIRREQSVMGVVVLKRDDGASFADEQRDIVERVVARAAVAIENSRLYSAVQAADRAKSEFVGIVAHDLKAPMTSIKGYTSLIQMQNGENLTERQTMFLTRIENTVKRMEVLVSDLADISRIESGHFYMEEIHVDVNNVVEAVRDTSLPEIEARQHQFILDVEPDLPELWVDYYRLMQVLTNLVSNAYKYTPDGGQITLKAAREGERIRFWVSDTGIGLSEEGIRKLGTKFWRAEDDYTRSQQGTGLGFAITASLVEQMGSQMHIESDIGQGSTFSFSVAIAQDASATP